MFNRFEFALAALVNSAAQELGLNKPVLLVIGRSRQGRAIEKELLKGNLHANVVSRTSPSDDSVFLLGKQDAANLLREHGEAGGSTIADEVERRGYAFWAVSVLKERISASAFAGGGEAFGMSVLYREPPASLSARNTLAAVGKGG